MNNPNQRSNKPPRKRKPTSAAAMDRRVRNARPAAADPRMPRFTLPSAVPLPGNSASMSRRDWIRFVERHLAGIDRVTGIDRIKLDRARGELMRARRTLHHSLGVPCPPWKPEGGGSVRSHNGGGR